MTAFEGTNIIRTSLQLYYDAGNTKSYPGSGTTITDLSGTGNHGTLTNGPTFTNGSIVFDGSNDYIYTPLNIDANPNTLCAWFYPTYIDAGGGAHAIMLSDNGGFDKGFEIYLGKFMVHTGNNYIQTSVSASTNTWYYGALTYTNTAMELFINGQSIWTGGAPAATTGSTLEIGRAFYNGGGGSRFFYGQIAVMKAYNRALTATEIQQNFYAHRGRFGL